MSVLRPNTTFSSLKRLTFRSELLRRHAQIHGPNSHRGFSGSSGMRERVSRACKRCAVSKLKCDDKKPCRRCVQRGQVCECSVRDDTFATVQDHGIVACLPRSNSNFTDITLLEEKVIPARQLEQVENGEFPFYGFSTSSSAERTVCQTRNRQRKSHNQ